jgi:bacterioferritin (cytochrome b1)
MNLGGINVDGLSVDEKRILVLSFYRDAELRGARLLFNLLSHLKDGASQIKMSRHIADETRHAWLWTRRLAALGAAPIAIPDGYQRRLGLRVGVPKSVVKLLALTIVVEERAQTRYLEHAASSDVDPATIEVLRAVTEDESWHLSWIKEKLFEIARDQSKESEAGEALSCYREIDREVWGSLMAAEAEMMRA